MGLYKKWVNHLKDNHMTYIEHMFFAMFYGFCCMFAGILLIIHSVLPCFFPTAGSNLVRKLNKRFSNENKK